MPPPTGMPLGSTGTPPPATTRSMPGTCAARLSPAAFPSCESSTITPAPAERSAGTARRAASSAPVTRSESRVGPRSAVSETSPNTPTLTGPAAFPSCESSTITPAPAERSAGTGVIVLLSQLGKAAGPVKVGVFGLVSETADLGPTRDSLRVTGAEEAARRAVPALRSAGAGVIVLLSQLGKAAGDSLAAHVPGIDLVVAGGGVPVLPSGMPAGGGRPLSGGVRGWRGGGPDVPPEGGGAAMPPSAPPPSR